MRVAIAHEWLTTLGGSERVVEALLELYPDAPVYTPFLSSRNLPESVREWDVRTSFVQKLPFLHRVSQKYIPLFPMAFESFDLSEYDLVISSSSACAKGVLTAPHTTHICRSVHRCLYRKGHQPLHLLRCHTVCIGHDHHSRCRQVGKHIYVHLLGCIGTAHYKQYSSQHDEELVMKRKLNDSV